MESQGDDENIVHTTGDNMSSLEINSSPGNEIPVEETPGDSLIQEISTTNVPTSVETTSKVEDEELQKVLEKRMQPIFELVDSERTYVQGLKLVSDTYIPLQQEPLPNLEIPSALSTKWRIVWGNWLQLYDWHRSFLDRLEKCLNDGEVDSIPKLLIDSQSRLRNIYSKYCENHRKAALIAELYRDFFEEVRVRVSDKQDIVSHLMKPVQRIMRYQLPMDMIVKYTEKAALPSLALWSRALYIMKEIPGDTQLILEAARIDGYPGVITALGKLRIRDDLLVASITSNDMRLLRSNGIGTPLSQSGSSASHEIHSPSDNVHNLCDSSSTPHYSTATNFFPASDPFTRTDGTSQDVDSLLKFQERRVFLFDQSLLITEEVKPKKSNPFAQSSFQFKSHITINKMKFESHWRRGRSTSAGSGGSASGPKADSTSNTVADDEDEIKFAIHEISRGKECIYVIDPLSMTKREAWVTQLCELQNQQMELLLALQDPMRFSEKNSRCGDVFYSGSGSLDSPLHMDKDSSKTLECDEQGGLLRLPTFNRRSHPAVRDTSKSSASTTSDPHCTFVRRNSDYADNAGLSPLSPTDPALLVSDEEEDLDTPTSVNANRKKKLQKSDSITAQTTGNRSNSSQSYTDSSFDCRHPHHQQSLPSRSTKKKSRIFSSIFGKSSQKQKSTSQSSANE